MRIAANNSSLERHVVLLRATQKMKVEMDRVWKDFFDKNPEVKEEDVRRWLEQRLKRQRNSISQHEEVRDHAQIYVSSSKNQ